MNHLLHTVYTSHMLIDDDLCDIAPREIEDSMETSFDKDVSGLAESILDMSIVEEREEPSLNVVGSFGFNKFTVPPLLCRHPPPATGRDDDEAKIKEILDDTLLKLGYLTSEERRANRILCGPDNKIGSCLLKLMSSNEKYHLFLPEFPLLHLRKSMITILFSSYQDAGLVHMLKYMRDDDQENWSRLISTHHIDAATKNVKRLGQAINLAFLVTFAKNLPVTECEMFLNDINSLEPAAVSTKWSGHLERFLDEGSERNATFALHREIMRHCIDISAVSLAERLGGSQGYQLLLAAVKSSVAFSFVNGASSYGPYCVQLMYHHYSAGHFHQKLKETLYTTPFGNSTKNFGCDTKREMDHLDALKGFRTGSTLSSVTSRMSLIDSLNEASRRRTDINMTHIDETENVTWSVSDVDMGHIHPTAALILRRKALSIEENHIPCNVYSKEPTALPASILDSNSRSVAEYLIKKFCVKENLFGCKESGIHQDHEITGPSDLGQRAKRTKGTTLKRTLKSKVTILKTEKQASEENRKKLVARKAKEIDSLTSQVNACQAFLKPDSSKPKVFKSLGMQRAILEQVQNCLRSLQLIDSGFSNQIDDYLQLGIQHIPSIFTTNTKFATLEFAGVKFKTANCTSGCLYLHFCETLITKSLREFPNVTDLIVCEEKYSHTPDDFKQATRSQRQSKVTTTIDHLKTTTSVLSDTAYNKDVLTKTAEGKALISKYLADNIDKLSIQKNIQLSIDSELIQESCECIQECSCTPAAIPVMKTFYENQLPSDSVQRKDIKQRKGEAEMSQVDWLIQNAHNLHPGEAAVSILTSGDIDALYIHLFALSRHWPRDKYGTFPSPVYVVLQKPGSKYDIYNLTLILELFEKIYDDKNIGVKVAVGLCIGGNDFVPKMQQLSHTTILKHVLKPKYRNTVISFENESISVNKDHFVYCIKDLYCPKRFDPDTLSFEQVRALTIGKNTAVSVSGHTTKDPKKWLPPESAIHRFADIVQLQIDYLLTAGCHEKELPDFLSKGCLVKRDGCIEYDFGPEAHFSSTDSLPVVSQSETANKRVNENTPQAGARRKRPLTSTPLKNST